MENSFIDYCKKQEDRLEKLIEYIRKYCTTKKRIDEVTYEIAKMNDCFMKTVLKKEIKNARGRWIWIKGEIKAEKREFIKRLYN